VYFDIQAKAAPETTKAQMRVLPQSLLQSRFRLTFHWQTKTMPIYQRSGGGPKLPQPIPGAKPGNHNMSSLFVTITAENTAIAESRRLARIPAAPPLSWTRPEFGTRFLLNLEYSDRLEDVSDPSVFAALERKLGLRLTAAKGPVEVFVVDHIDKRRRRTRTLRERLDDSQSARCREIAPGDASAGNAVRSQQESEKSIVA
jgi:uncharacterized protein (TIGR03435 family)